MSEEMINEVEDIDIPSEEQAATEEIAEEEKAADAAEEAAPERSIVIEEALEAILFAAGHPVSYATLARVFDTTPSKIKDIIFDYAIKYNKSELQRGVILLTYQESCQLCTKELYLPEIRDALGIRKSGSLSTAAMETLAVVAYNQPVTRVFVDTIRKVDSSYAMNSLIDRGLIECVGRLDVPGRPMQYGTTSDFLRCFGLKSIDELPPATEDLVSMFEKARINEEETRASEDAQMTISDIDGAEISENTETDSADAQPDGIGTAESVMAEADTSEFEDTSAEDDIVDM